MTPEFKKQTQVEDLKQEIVDCALEIEEILNDDPSFYRSWPPTKLIDLYSEIAFDAVADIAALTA